MRLFIAIDAGKAATDKIRRLSTGMEKSKSIRAIDPDNVHITLKFLGEVRDDDVGRVSEAVRTALSGFGSFRMAIEGMGYFGSARNPRVAWLGIGAGRETVIGMMQKLEQSLTFIRSESRTGQPHITLARLKAPAGAATLIDFVAKNKGVKVCEVDVKDVRLKRSVLTPTGAQYTDIEVYQLE
ncbi:MAG: RNA 2',3'-cyclic phosphodiesterase [Candidatus Aenigmarchaeota archaeon]|nr:RNA 2',3'-cyclic phosphodiesterase [Candidatus Aenigmarchaeota archaeon]